MDQIAYHPIRVSSHSSLFLPYTPQELEQYHNQSLNPLRERPPLPSQVLHPYQILQQKLHYQQPPQSQPQPQQSQSPPAGAAPLTVPGGGAISQQTHRSPPVYSSPSPLLISIDKSDKQTPVDSKHNNHPQRQSRSTSASIKADQSNLKNYPNNSSNNRSFSENLNFRSRSIHNRDDYSLESSNHDRFDNREATHYDRRFREADDYHSQNYNDRSISETVAYHYNSRPNKSRDERTESPIFGVRKLNNWIKSFLIGKFSSLDYYSNKLNNSNNGNSLGNGNGLKALELGCGKGGDLAKWDKAGVQELYGFDIAEVSVEQARERYSNSSKRFYAKFTALDCFSYPIETVLSKNELSRPFDSVSLQFCMHYAFENEFKVRMMFENVTKFLKPGGTFIGTIPDSDNLMKRLDECKNNQSPSAMNPDGSFSWGNSVYQIQFFNSNNNSDGDEEEERLKNGELYGFRYMFYLKDAVENVPEYVVFWEPFVRLAEEYGLRLIFKQNFHEIYENEYRKFNNNSNNINHSNDQNFSDYDNNNDQSFLKLLMRMKVIDYNGRKLISQDQWEVAGLYIGFAFVKQ